MSRFVKVGENANIFHDPSTGITVCKGEVVELNERQLLTKRVRTALSSGHLIYGEKSVNKKEKEIDNQLELRLLSEKLYAMYKSGKDSKKASEAFTLEQLKMLAEESEITVEESDTKASIAQALYEDIEENKD